MTNTYEIKLELFKKLLKIKGKILQIRIEEQTDGYMVKIHTDLEA